MVGPIEGNAIRVLHLQLQALYICGAADWVVERRYFTRSRQASEAIELAAKTNSNVRSVPSGRDQGWCEICNEEEE